MQHPNKWRETIDPFSLKFNNIQLLEVLGYPHAGNDVFYAKALYKNKETNCYVKVARSEEVNFVNEINLLKSLPLKNIPQLLDYEKDGKFIVTKEIKGERLSTLVGGNTNRESHSYMEEYGKNLALLHSCIGTFSPKPERKFTNIPSFEYLKENNLDFVYNYLIENQPKTQDLCFCHGDFHYANLLWKNKKLVAILDFELAGLGDRDFDIAWSLILRPSQRFMNTEKELDLFLKGYSKISSFNKEKVTYYMALIYCYFYSFKSNTQEYKNYILQWLKNTIK